MEKIEFKNLPDKTTPINATNLKKMQDNIEEAIEVQNVIETDTNLNDYKTTGVYAFNTNTKPTNIPTGVNGWLVVYSHPDTAIKQIWYRWGTNDTNHYETYIRNFDSNKWSSWVRLIAENDLYYKDGDTITLGDTNFSGHITGSTMKIWITVPVAKSMKNISKITCNNLTVVMRGINGYLNSNSSSIDVANNDEYTITCFKETDNLMLVGIEKTAAFTNVSNNTPVNIKVYAGTNKNKFTFNK